MLHLAIESGKDWDGGIAKLFESNPDAVEIQDSMGKVPLVAALLTYCEGSSNNSARPKDENLLLSESLTHIESSEIDDDEVMGTQLAQINVLFHLLKVAPHVLNQK